MTGGRLKYGGRSYFAEVRHVLTLALPTLRFTASRFVIEHPRAVAIEQAELAPLLLAFYRERASERLLVRLRHWERQTGLQARELRIRVFQSRWASCDAHDVLYFHPRVMELAASVQDYVVLHELCHTAEKSHTRAFCPRVAEHMPDWRPHHQVLGPPAFGVAI